MARTRGSGSGGDVSHWVLRRDAHRIPEASMGQGAAMGAGGLDTGSRLHFDRGLAALERMRGLGHVSHRTQGSIPIAASRPQVQGDLTPFPPGCVAHPVHAIAQAPQKPGAWSNAGWFLIRTSRRACATFAGCGSPRRGLALMMRRRAGVRPRRHAALPE
jgi:hypothetical protein